MAVILTSTSESADQLTEALTSAGHAVQVQTEGDAPEKSVGITETQVEKPAEKVAEEPKPVDKPEPASEPGQEEKKEEVKTEGEEKPEAEEKTAKEPEPTVPKPDRKLLKRIDAVTAQKNQLKETLEEKEARILELEAKLSGKTLEESKPESEATKPVRPRMPVASDPEIGYDEEKLTAAREKYEKALDKYEDDNATYIKAATAKELSEKALKEKLETEARAIDDAHIQRVKEAEARHDDWGEVTDALDDTGFVLHPAVFTGIKESEQGAEIIYYLATHLEEAEKFSNMRPDRALRELGRLEAQFTDGGRRKPREKDPEPEEKKAKEPEVKTKEPSSEPKPPAKPPKEPMKTLGGDSKPVTMDPLDIAEKQGSVLEYMRMRTAAREAKGLRP